MLHLLKNTRMSELSVDTRGVPGIQLKAEKLRLFLFEGLIDGNNDENQYADDIQLHIKV